jgi:3-oxoacyl-[acyl-carrier-protein] synthase-3
MKHILHSIRYALGENRRLYSDIEDFERIRTEYRIPNAPSLLGFGEYFQTDEDIITLGVRAASETLDRSGLHREEVDYVLFCSADYSSVGAKPGDGYTRLLCELGLTNAYPVGLTLNGCTCALAALRMAASLLSDPTVRNVLVISADKLTCESNRVSRHAIFSDGAVSCLVSKASDSGFELVDTVLRSDVSVMTEEGKQDDLQLFRSAMSTLVSRNAVTPEDIEMVFSGNIYTAISQYKEAAHGLGINRSQLFVANVPKVSHSFAADALINLADYSASVAPTEKYYLLTATSVGLRGLALLRSINSQRPCP